VQGVVLRLAVLGVHVRLALNDLGQVRHGQRPIPVRQTVLEAVGLQCVLSLGEI
jgi:hypothetical protein